MKFPACAVTGVDASAPAGAVAEKAAYRQVVAIVVTERTVKVALSRAEEPIAVWNASVLFNFVSLVMPTTSMV